MLDERFFYSVFKEMAKQRNPPDNVIHVSDVTGCLLKSYYMRRRPFVTEAQAVVFRVGEGVHTALQRYLHEKYGWSYEVEARMPIEDEYGEFELVGHADLLSPDNEVVEVKTTSKIPDEPYRSHVMQLNAYMYMLKAKAGYVLYIEKGGGRIRVFPVQFSKKLWGEVVRRAIKLHKALVTNTPPEPEPNHLCRYCPYKFDCLPRRKRDEVVELVEYFQRDPIKSNTWE